MENKESKQKPPKSMILLLISIFFLFNAAHLFRTSINTLYFTEDISGDYATVQATVQELQADLSAGQDRKPSIIPVFSFQYNGKEVVLDAPKLAFTLVAEGKEPFKQGEEYTLWVHKRWGELIVPPLMAPDELGRSQLKISAVFLLLAIMVWVLRNKIAAKALS